MDAGTQFIIDPSRVAEAVMSGRKLLVSVWGERLQFHKVELTMDRTTNPPTEAAVKAAEAMRMQA